MNRTGTNQSIPYGYCHCGCGNETQLATKTAAQFGHVKGRPIRYICGHNNTDSDRIDTADLGQFKIDDTYCRLISLSKGKFAIVDALDFEWINRFTWFAKWNPSTSSFYACRSARVPSGKQTTIKMHRAILGLEVGDPAKVDHINNQATLDNRRGNLRIATPSQNSFNKGRYRTNTSGFKGVTKYTDGIRWTASISANGRRKHLGIFVDPKEAHAAYRAAAEALHGDFRRTS